MVNVYQWHIHESYFIILLNMHSELLSLVLLFIKSFMFNLLNILENLRIDKSFYCHLWYYDDTLCNNFK